MQKMKEEEEQASLQQEIEKLEKEQQANEEQLNLIDSKLMGKKAAKWSNLGWNKILALESKDSFHTCRYKKFKKLFCSDEQCSLVLESLNWLAF